MNGASAVGRIVPNLFANYFGVWNTVVPCVAIASMLVFTTLAINNAPGTIAFAILFGFFQGSCESFTDSLRFRGFRARSLLCSSSFLLAFRVFAKFANSTDASLLPPMITSLSSHDYEIGARMGVCFVFTGQSTAFEAAYSSDSRVLHL